MFDMIGSAAAFFAYIAWVMLVVCFAIRPDMVLLHVLQIV